MTKSSLLLESPKKILGIKEEQTEEANKIIWAVFGNNSRVLTLRRPRRTGIPGSMTRRNPTGFLQPS